MNKTIHKRHLFTQAHIMNTPLFNSTVVVLLVAFFTCSAVAAHKKNDPIEQARHHLERAHDLINKKEGGAVAKKGKKDIPNIINVLGEAETSLAETKNNKGSNTSVSLKLIADAKAELEAAKGGQEEAHLSKADEDIQDALKHVMQAIRVHGARS
jgi:hypothetical protein